MRSHSSSDTRRLLPLFGLFAAAVLVLTACTTGPIFVPIGTPDSPLPTAPPPPTESAFRATEAVAALMTALEKDAATLQWGGTVNQPFFAVPGWLIRMNGQDVQAFEYATEAARLEDSTKISPDGASVGTEAIQWTGQPNFWATDKLIVLYVGGDNDIKAVLGKTLGEPLTKPGAVVVVTNPDAAPTVAATSAAPAAATGAATPETATPVASEPASPPASGEVPALMTNVTLVQAIADLPIYLGPGADYQEVGRIDRGGTAVVEGVSADGNWWRTVCPDIEGVCWISGDPGRARVVEAR